jgi:hypothetical protein
MLTAAMRVCPRGRIVPGPGRTKAVSSGVMRCSLTQAGMGREGVVKWLKQAPLLVSARP